MTYKVKFPVGDWSDDGHGKCDWFHLESSVSVEDLREMYFDTCTRTGVVFDNEICSNYQDSTKIDEQVKKLGLTKEEVAFDEEEFEVYGVTQDLFMNIFIAWLKKHNPGLELSVSQDDTPRFTFYGFDEKNRHIGHLGYGLFQ